MGHVDDLLIGGSPYAVDAVHAVGQELGFGSFEIDDFIWCGKKFVHDGAKATIPMEAYASNLAGVTIARTRRQTPDSALNPTEHRVLRRICGGLQWLVSQARLDLCFAVSGLQGELKSPKVSSLVKANAAVRQAQAGKLNEMVFPSVDLRGAGIMVVTDASLGAVVAQGHDNAAPLERTRSQGGYTVLLADAKLM